MAMAVNSTILHFIDTVMILSFSSYDMLNVRCTVRWFYSQPYNRRGFFLFAALGMLPSFALCPHFRYNPS